MKARQFLTIELPEGFKKGDCKKCPFSFKIPSSKAKEEWETHCIFERNPKNCPVEVYDENGKAIKGGISA